MSSQPPQENVSQSGVILMSMPSESLPRRLGTLLTRVVVPLWVLAGALFKLHELNPGNLPIVIRDPAKQMGIDLMILLRTLIGLELFAVLVMVLVRRLSRAMAIFMLCGFCLILIGETIKKASSCGCFGSLPLKPWHMLVIDGSLLLLVIISWQWERVGRIAVDGEGAEPIARPSLLKPALALIPLLAVGLLAGFGRPTPPPKPQRVESDDHGPPPTTQLTANNLPGPSNSSTSQPTIKPPTSDTPATTPAAGDPTRNPNPMAIPVSWYTPADVAKEWTGKPWREIDLFRLMKRWPKDLDAGKHYVVFYRRTCDHCHEMFMFDFFQPLDAPLAAVEIPETASQMRPADAWDMPSTAPMEMLELPLGCNYTLTTPLALRIENGRITCAEEGGHKKCLGLQ
jgi:hypothetical protein